MTPEVRGPDGVVGHEIEPWLSVLPEKRRRYGVDLYYTEAWEELLASGIDLQDALLSHALVVCKPDAIAGRRVEAGLEWFSRNGIPVVAAEPCRMTRHLVRALWEFQWNIASADRRDLTEMLMTAADALMLVVRLPEEAVPATVRMAALKGPVGTGDPAHLRSAMGAANSVINSVHSTDEPADVVRELSVFLDPPARARVIAAMASGAAADPSRLVADLYARTSAESTFDFDVRFADHPARAATDWRAYTASAGPSWSTWDTVVLGTHLMTPHRPGLARIIPGVSPARWAEAAVPHPK